jgi:nucleotide-binding universal stress UspA family protein
MLDHAVVGVDFAPGWDRLRDRLDVLARLGAGRVTLLHVLGGHYPAAPEVRHQDHYERRLDEEAARLARDGLEVDRLVRIGEPARELAIAAAELGAGLVVLGSAGHTPLRDAALGNVVAEVLRYAAVPLLLVPLGDHVAAGGGGAVLGTDGSDAARAAEGLARHLARTLPVAVVTVTRDGEDAGSFALDGEAVEVIARHGKPSEQIAQVADERSADVVIVGRRGRNPVVGMLLGSTAEHLVAAAHRPVLLAA